MSIRVNWRPDSDAEYPSYTGTDEQGNVYRMNACRDIVSVRLVDGRTGQGWTEEQALAAALRQPAPRRG